MDSRDVKCLISRYLCSGLWVVGSLFFVLCSGLWVVVSCSGVSGLDVSVLGVSVLGVSVLGVSVLGVSVLGVSVLGVSVLGGSCLGGVVWFGWRKDGSVCLLAKWGVSFPFATGWHGNHANKLKRF